MIRKVDRLMFVYNADSGALNAVLDSAKKLLAIGGCPLCSLTHSLAGESREWQTYKDSLGVEIEYVHRNELSGGLRFLVGDDLPCIVAETGSNLTLLLESDAIEECRGKVADLNRRIREEAARIGLAI